MTDEDDQSKIRYLKVVLSLCLLILFSGFLYFGIDFIARDTSGQGEYSVSCGRYDGKMATGEELKEEWVISDNITNYADIPQSQKDNLSNDTVEILKRANGSFKATHYTNMSSAEKELFRKALNTSVRSNTRPYGRVIYRGRLYSCDVAVLEGT
jgi:hypothetical protein